MNTKRNILKRGILFLAALALPLGATALAVEDQTVIRKHFPELLPPATK